jgi:hypothetical protein
MQAYGAGGIVLAKQKTLAEARRPWWRRWLV